MTNFDTQTTAKGALNTAFFKVRQLVLYRQNDSIII